MYLLFIKKLMSCYLLEITLKQWIFQLQKASDILTIKTIQE